MCIHERFRHGDGTESARSVHDFSAILGGVEHSSSRLPWPLVDEVRRLACSSASVAEICRVTGRFAAARGFQQPSYETVRLIVLHQRATQTLPGVRDPLVDGWLRARSPANAVDEAFRRAKRRADARSTIEAEREWRPPGAVEGSQGSSRPGCRQGSTVAATARRK